MCVFFIYQSLGHHGRHLLQQAKRPTARKSENGDVIICSFHVKYLNFFFLDTPWYLNKSLLKRALPKSWSFLVCCSSSLGGWRGQMDRRTVHKMHESRSGEWGLSTSRVGVGSVLVLSLTRSEVCWIPSPRGEQHGACYFSRAKANISVCPRADICCVCLLHVCFTQ